MVLGDRDPAIDRRGKAFMWQSLVAASAAMIVVGLLAFAAAGCGSDGSEDSSRDSSSEDSSRDSGGLIAFVADKGSGYQIYTVRPNGHGLRQITHVDGEALNPDWSPDGSQIAFALNECSVAIMNADGTDRRVLPSETPGGCEADPSFTPDGSRLVYERYDPPDDDAVWSMNLDGTDRQRVTAPNMGAPDPNVSPDGGTVSFVCGKKEGELQALCAVEIDGSNVRKLTTYGLEAGIKHDWAPNGKHIVLTPHADYPNHKSPNVATIRPDGSGLRMLTGYTGGKQGAFAGSYSPNGRWIVFRVENLKRERFRLLKMRPDGTHRTLIKRLPFGPGFIDWGPRP